MGGRRVGRLGGVVAFAILLASPAARAQKVAIVDLYGEADVRAEASAVTFIIRSTLSDGKATIVPRAELEVAFARAGVQRSGAVRRLSIDQIRDLLVSTGSAVVIAGEVQRSGAELRATALVFRSGSAIQILSASAGDGNASSLADKLSQALAADLKGTARPRPNTSTGRLRAFADADASLRTGEVARALEHLRSADAQTAGRVPAAREIPAAILADASQPLAARIDAALLAVEPDKALELATAALAKNRADPVAALGAARAHLSRMNVQAAAAALAPLERSTDPAVLTARAEMAHYAEDRELRDQLLTQLFAQPPPVAVLAVIDLIPAGALPAELEARVLAAAEALPTSWLRSALGVRAAAGKVDPARALGLVRIPDLDDGELALVRPIAAAGGSPEAKRLAAELALYDAEYPAARKALESWLAEAPDDPRARLQLGRLLVQEGKPGEGAVELARAAASGIDSALREQAMALLLAGDVAGARALLARMQDEAAVLATVAAALVMLEAGDLTGARAQLERAAALSAANPDVLRALVEMSRARGGPPLTPDVKLLADRLAAPAPDASSARAVELPKTKVKKGAGGALGMLDGIIAKQLRGLPLGDEIHRVAVVPLAGEGHPFFHWYRLDPDPVDAALRRVLEHAPYSLSIAAASGTETEPLAADRLESVARAAKADAVVLYRVIADGSDVEIKLVLFVPGMANAAEVVEVVDGRSAGLVRWNRLFLAVIGLLLVALIGWAGLPLLRGSGAVQVTIVKPPGASDEMFAIELTRSSKRPAYDPDKFRGRMKRAGHKVGRRSATLVSATTRFARVPPGRWHVHLLGFYTMGGETRDLGATQSSPVHVNRKATTEIKFDLTSSKAELQVRIYNPGGAASGILVSLDEHNRGRTDANGEVRLEVVPGEYVLKVEAPDLEVSQLVSVLIPGAQKVAVHLDREKRRADVLGDLSIHDTEAGELVIERNDNTRSRPISVGAVAATLGRRTASLEPGGSIGKYDLVSELGRGAMGLVYRARDRKLEREVAIKIISDELRSHPVAMQLFLDEAKALAQLNHPNIVGVYDQSEDDGVTYMVMELVEGQTLEEIIAQRGRLPVSEALEIIDQLCAGLAYAHERKVIHRDIKPANIFVTADRTVKLGDFGLARVMREIAIRRTEVRGTPLYMAPEQVTGTDIDRRADLYAVGCTLFELLTGQPPFTDGDIMFQQLHTAPPRPSTRVGGLPPELDLVVLACLEKDRKARIDSATVLRERLRSVRP